MRHSKLCHPQYQANRARQAANGHPAGPRALTGLPRTALPCRYPVTLTHALDEDSPIAHWATQKGLRQDADAEVVVVARVRGEGQGRG